MATIKVLNASQVNPEAPVEIKLGIVNEPDKPIQYVGIPGPEGKPGKDGKQGPQGQKGDTPVKGVDYFTPQDIAAIAAQVPVPEVDLSDYASKSFVETAIRGAETGLLKRSIVEELPVNNIDDNTIYMVPKIGDIGDVYDEYLYVNNAWEHIGSTDVDLTGYATEQYVNDKIVLSGPFHLIDLYRSPPDASRKSYKNNSADVIRDLKAGKWVQGWNQQLHVADFGINPLYRATAWNPPTANRPLQECPQDSFFTLTENYWYALDGNVLWIVEYSSQSFRQNIMEHIVNNVEYIKPGFSSNTLSGIISELQASSSSVQYLTNSDILAIWNGENN